MHTHTHTHVVSCAQYIQCNQNIRPPPSWGSCFNEDDLCRNLEGGLLVFSFCFVYGFGIIITRPINKSVRTGDWAYDYVLLLQRQFGAYKQKWQRHQREEQTDDRCTLITRRLVLKHKHRRNSNSTKTDTSSTVNDNKNNT